MADQVTSDQAPLTENLGIGLTARAALSLQRGQYLHIYLFYTAFRWVHTIQNYFYIYNEIKADITFVGPEFS